jgi:hypothetical protein
MSKQGKAAEVVEREIVDTMDAVDRRERPVRRVQISAEQFAADMARRTSR